QATVWVGMAAQQGHAESQYELGLCYLRGVGVEENVHTAVNWCKRAVQNGSIAAEAVAGFRGIEQNLALKNAYPYKIVRTCCVELVKRGYGVTFGRIEKIYNTKSGYKAAVNVCDAQGTYLGYIEFSNLVLTADPLLTIGLKRNAPEDHRAMSEGQVRHIIEVDDIGILISSRNYTPSNAMPEWMIVCAGCRIYASLMLNPYPTWVLEYPMARQYVNVLDPTRIPIIPLLDIGLLSGTSEIQQNSGRVVPPVATTPSSKTVMSEQEIGNFLAHRSLQIRMLIEGMFLEQGIEVKIEVIDGHFGDNDWLFTSGYVFRCKSRNDEFYLSMRGHIARIKSDNPRDIARWIEGDVGLQTKISNKADIIAYKTGTSQELINQVVNLCNTAVLPVN
ncbi:MAG: tetratricopeptide repeat protein, partial [Thermoguttaceae bacterium]